MHKDFIPYEQALALKELGFNEPCFGAYIGNKLKIFEFSNDIKGYANDANLIIAAPIFSQAFRWFREKYNLCHQITRAGRDDEFNAFVSDYIYGNNGKYSPSIFTYEEAELECLKKLIKIIKTK